MKAKIYMESDNKSIIIKEFEQLMNLQIENFDNKIHNSVFIHIFWESA